MPRRHAIGGVVIVALVTLLIAPIGAQYRPGTAPNCTQAELVASAECSVLAFLDDKREEEARFQLHHNAINDTFSLLHLQDELMLFDANAVTVSHPMVVANSLAVRGLDILDEIARVEAFAANMTDALIHLTRSLCNPNPSSF